MYYQSEGTAAQALKAGVPEEVIATTLKVINVAIIYMACSYLSFSYCARRNETGRLYRNCSMVSQHGYLTETSAHHTGV